MKKYINLVVCLMLIATPVVFMPSIYLVFELPKVSLFKGGVLLLLFLGIWQILREKEIFYPILKKQISILIPFSVWVLAMLLSTINSTSLSLSFFGEYHKLLGLFTWLFIYLWTFLLIIFIKKDQNEKLLNSLIIGSFLVSLYGVMQKLGLDPITSWQDESFLGRVFSSFGQPNFLGSFLILLIPLTAVFLKIKFEERNFNWILFLFTTLILQFLALGFTGSRAGFLGLLIGIFFGLIIYSIAFNKKSFKKAFLFFSIIPVLVIFINIIHFSSSINIPLTSRILFTSENLRSIESRIYIWESAIKIIKDYPVLGTGLETFYINFPKYQDTKLLKLESFKETADRAHNQVLDMASTIGIPGTIAYYIFLLILILKTVSHLKKSEDRKNKLIFTAILAGMISLEISHLFGFALITHLMIFWFFIALIIKEICEFKKAQIFISNNFSLSIKSIFLIFIIYGIWSFSISPLIADADFNKGKFFLENTNILEGVELYEQTISENSIPVFYWLHLSNGYIVLAEKALIEKKSEYIEKAENSIKIAKKKAPIDYNVYYLNGRALTQKALLGATSKDNVFHEYDNAIFYAPNNPSIYMAYGKSAYDLQDYKKSIEVYEKLLQISPNYWQNPLKTKAEQEKSRIFFKDNPDFKKIFLYLARSYTLQGNFQKALDYLTYADQNVDTLSTYATIYMEMGDIKKAKEYTLKALELDPDNMVLKGNLEKLGERV